MTRAHWSLLILSAGFASIASAAEPLRFNDPQPQRHELSARAGAIDPRCQSHPEINFFLEKDGRPQDVQQASVDTRAAPQGKLVIWLMGHSPQLFERVSGYGLHILRVHYANGWFARFGKEPPPNDDQFLGKIRLEAAIGEDVSDAVAIPFPDSIKSRSFQFVKWLAHEHPAGRWEIFLNDAGDDLRWERVILAGASHGSTTAARFAKHQRVERVVMFCGPRDQYETWQALPSATPAQRFFGFSHVLDTGWSGDHYCRSWELLGLAEFGPIVNVDQSQPPFENTRRLVTAADVNQDVNRAHSCVIPGNGSVKDSAGNYVHEAAWRYLFTHPVDQTGTPTPADPQCRKNLRVQE